MRPPPWLSTHATCSKGGNPSNKRAGSPLRVPKNDPIVVVGYYLGVLLVGSSQGSGNPSDALMV